MTKEKRLQRIAFWSAVATWIGIVAFVAFLVVLFLSEVRGHPFYQTILPISLGGWAFDNFNVFAFAAFLFCLISWGFISRNVAKNKLDDLQEMDALDHPVRGVPQR